MKTAALRVMYAAPAHRPISAEPGSDDAFASGPLAWRVIEVHVSAARQGRIRSSRPLDDAEDGGSRRWRSG